MPRRPCYPTGRVYVYADFTFESSPPTPSQLFCPTFQDVRRQTQPPRPGHSELSSRLTAHTRQRGQSLKPPPHPRRILARLAGYGGRDCRMGCLSGKEAHLTPGSGHGWCVPPRRWCAHQRRRNPGGPIEPSHISRAAGVNMHGRVVTPALV